MNNEHYQSRLRLVLNDAEYPAALELLTEASVNGGLLCDETVKQYREHFRYSLKNSFHGIFHYRKTKAWFCFAPEFNGLRHRIRRHIRVPREALT